MLSVKKSSVHHRQQGKKVGCLGMDIPYSPKSQSVAVTTLSTTNKLDSHTVCW